MTREQIIQKVWSFCHALRDVGVSYGDYLEQLTFLIFLKMAHEYTKPPHKRQMGIPSEYAWPRLCEKRGAELEVHYIDLLLTLGQQKGMLGAIFTKAQNKIQDPAMLSKVIDMIDKEDWLMLGSDVKGEIYEGLLERNAEDVKSGAGQYFTPRALIKAMVECIRPEPGQTIADPACGTGGFFLAAYDFILEQHRGRMDADTLRFLKDRTFHGHEIVPSTRRLCLMNMLLHNIGDIDGEPTVQVTDALLGESGMLVDLVLTNPPFGKKSSFTVTNESGEEEREDLTYSRQDFWVTTSNKQLNFVQHVYTLLKENGRAAVVVPDNVLFEGGVGETVRRMLLQNTDLHTILRLPTGIFYAQGVKANVLFFDRKTASPEPWTKEVWVYDYRTNVHHTLKKKPLRREDLSEFVACYMPENRARRQQSWDPQNNPLGRWRRFGYDEIVARDKTSLDIFWLKDDSLADLDNLPEPDMLAQEIIENIEAALSSFREIANSLVGNE